MMSRDVLLFKIYNILNKCSALNYRPSMYFF